jgi:hemerythrin superfamily protein
MPDALQMLKEDHRAVQDLFKEFEETTAPAEKKRIVTQAIKELEIHSQLEEEIFYPAVWREAEPEDELMYEAEEEHHVVDLLIKELRRLQPSAEQYDAKFKVLAENVKHHIQEEESMMLPKAAELGGGRMSQLGEEMTTRKAELMRAYGSRSSNGRRATRTTGTRRTAPKRAVKTARRGSANGRRRTTRTTAARRASTVATAAARRAGASARRTTRSAASTTRRATTPRRATTRSRRS